MKIKTFPQKKALYLLEKPIEEWLKVFNKISDNNKKKWCTNFPSVKGFRDNHSSSYEPRFKKLINKAKKKTYDESFQGLLLIDLLVYWTISNDQLNQILIAYNNDDDFLEIDQHIPPNSFLDIGCFISLRKAEQEGRVDIEDIILFYEFGYFLKDPIIDMIVYDDKSDIENVAISNQFIFDFIKHYFTKATQREETYEIREYVDFITDDISEYLTDKFKNIKKMIQDVSESQKNEDIEYIITPINKKIKSIEQIIEKFNTTKDDIDNRLAHFSEKMQYIEQLIDNLNTTIMEKELETKPEIAEKRITSSIHLTQIQVPEKIKFIDSYKSLHQHMVKNFKAIGLINKKAKKLSTEILAGLGTGSLITFSGSLSFLLAEICARSIAANNDIQILHIPVGLLDGHQFHKEITRCLNKSSQSDYLTAIIFEGINLSAFECYAQTLSQMITNRLINYQNSHKHVLCFATLAEGPAALPLTKEFCMFGPIFNTDLLGWGAKGINDKIQGGTISTENWNHWLNSCSKSEIPESLESLLVDMSDITQLWKISIRKVCQFINSKNPLESIGFGWLMPLAMCDLINQELLFQFCEENIDEKHDDRVVKLIRNIKKD